MTLTQERKLEIAAKYQLHATDTGSSDLQVAMLTEKITRLSEHLKTNKSDHASRRGLLKMIGQRKRLLAFIQGESVQRYQALADSLGIRRVKD